MHVDGHNISFNIWEELNVVIYIPFAKTDTKVIARIPDKCVCVREGELKPVKIEPL